MASLSEHQDGRQRRWVVVWRDPETRQRRRQAFYTLSEAKTFLHYALAPVADATRRSRPGTQHGK
jgi:hypothetical protein